MRLVLALEHAAARVTTVGGVMVICACLLYAVVCDFIVGALADERIPVTSAAEPASFITAPFTDDRIGVNPDVLARASHYFANSPRLAMRLAELRRYDGDDNWRTAELEAQRAIRLSPHDYRPRLLMATIQEYQANYAAAEESAQAALRLAPGHLQTHWELGVLRVDRGDLAGSIEEFRAAASGHDAYFREALKLVWSKSNKSIDAVRAITPDKPTAQLALAQFLLGQSRIAESVAVFGKINRRVLLRDKASSAYIDGLIASGNVALAHDIWLDLVHPDSQNSGAKGSISNSGFESDILLDFVQFDWAIQPSDYARISIDSSSAHSGKRSLRIDFAGHETTKLDKEIQQRILVRQGARYRLTYYIRAAGLISEQTPQVVVSGAASSEWNASSGPVALPSRDWEQREFEFRAPAPVLSVSIKQRPMFSYEDPTHGTVWFDDFGLEEVP